jgi:hypothetical protein
MTSVIVGGAVVARARAVAVLRPSTTPGKATSTGRGRWRVRTSNAPEWARGRLSADPIPHRGARQELGEPAAPTPLMPSAKHRPHAADENRCTSRIEGFRVRETMRRQDGQQESRSRPGDGDQPHKGHLKRPAHGRRRAHGGWQRSSGALQKVPYSEHPPRYEYRLTAKGRDLWPYAAPDGPPLQVVHTTCGEVADAVMICSCCGDRVTAHNVKAVPGPGDLDGLLDIHDVELNHCDDRQVAP